MMKNWNPYEELELKLFYIFLSQYHGGQYLQLLG